MIPIPDHVYIRGHWYIKEIGERIMDNLTHFYCHQCHRIESVKQAHLLGDLQFCSQICSSKFINQNQRPQWPGYFLSIARVVSTRASCPRAQVGVVITDQSNRIISTGYNGAPAGKDDCLVHGCLMENDHCIRTVHAEQNALGYAAQAGVSTKGANMWVWFERGDSENYSSTDPTQLAQPNPPYSPEDFNKLLSTFPCRPCAMQMYASGIGKVTITEDGEYVLRYSDYSATYTSGSIITLSPDGSLK